MQGSEFKPAQFSLFLFFKGEILPPSHVYLRAASYSIDYTVQSTSVMSVIYIDLYLHCYS